MLDTCVLFDFMAGKEASPVVERLLKESKAGISVISVYELFRGVESQRHIEQRDQLVSLCKVMELTRPVARKASEIYTFLKKEGRLIVNQDILIAATALFYGWPLLTINQKDFKHIPNIHLLEI